MKNEHSLENIEGTSSYRKYILRCYDSYLSDEREGMILEEDERFCDSFINEALADYEITESVIDFDGSRIEVPVS